MIELNAVLIGGLGLENFKRPVDCALRQPLQIDAGWSESLGDAGFRKLS